MKLIVQLFMNYIECLFSCLPSDAKHLPETLLCVCSCVCVCEREREREGEGEGEKEGEGEGERERERERVCERERKSVCVFVCAITLIFCFAAHNMEGKESRACRCNTEELYNYSTQYRCIQIVIGLMQERTPFSS